MNLVGVYQELLGSQMWFTYQYVQNSLLKEIRIKNWFFSKFTFKKLNFPWQIGLDFLKANLHPNEFSGGISGTTWVTDVVHLPICTEFPIKGN